MPKHGSKRGEAKGSTRKDPEDKDHIRSNLGIADRIKWLRLYRKKTQSEFAKDLGVSQVTVSGWESGRDTHPLGVSSAVRMHDVYRVSLDWLFLGVADALPREMENAWLDRQAGNAPQWPER